MWHSLHYIHVVNLMHLVDSIHDTDKRCVIFSEVKDDVMAFEIKNYDVILHQCFLIFFLVLHDAKITSHNVIMDV